jgi:hypothetical protein
MPIAVAAATSANLPKPYGGVPVSLLFAERAIEAVEDGGEGVEGDRGLARLDHDFGRHTGDELDFGQLLQRRFVDFDLCQVVGLARGLTGFGAIID